MKPFWVTFYSYKGGVGRSLALANLAALLVKRGRRVLLIDFDLEAPGLDSFAEFAPAAGKPGVVEYVGEFLHRQVAPDIRTFVHHCALPGPYRGSLSVMPAGRKDAAYNHQLARINWAELYESGLGTPFFENWKAAIDHHFQPDYVFVDSRTGLTEVGGVCTIQFPDLVVMLFGLNNQNVRGTAKVAQCIREADPDRIPQIHFVATPIPNLPPDQPGVPSNQRAQDRRGQLTERMDAATTELGVRISSVIRYYSPASLSEKLFVLEEGFMGPSINRDYQRLCEEITKFNRTGLDFLIQQAEEAIAEVDSTRLDRLSAVLERDYPDRAEAIYLQARFALARNDPTKAVELAEKSFQLDPAFKEAFHFLSSHYSRAQQPERVVALFDTLLARPELISPARRSDIQDQRGHTLMRLGRHEEALQCFTECEQSATAEEEPPSIRFIHRFNSAESKRRSSQAIFENQWKLLAEQFADAGAAIDSPSPTQANQWQAMHIAFACSGDLAAARDALRKARRAAESISEIEDVFSVKAYREVPVAEFLAINDEMLAALDQGELWDGMKLSPQTS